MACRFVCSISLLLVLSARAFAEAPALVPVTGFITDDDERPLEGAHSLRFRLYGTATGAGSVLHDEAQTITLHHGAFVAYLGHTTPLDLAAFAQHAQVWLGLQIGDEPEGEPRIRLATAPYAAVAQYCAEAQLLQGHDVAELRSWAGLTGVPSAFPPSAHTHAFSDLASIPKGFADGIDDTGLSSIVAKGGGLESHVDGSTAEVSLASCSDGQVLRVVDEQWSCSSAPTSAGVVDLQAGDGLVADCAHGSCTLSIDRSVSRTRYLNVPGVVFKAHGDQEILDYADGWIAVAGVPLNHPLIS